MHNIVITQNNSLVPANIVIFTLNYEAVQNHHYYHPRDKYRKQIYSFHKDNNIFLGEIMLAEMIGQRIQHESNMTVGVVQYQLHDDNTQNLNIQCC